MKNAVSIWLAFLIFAGSLMPNSDMDELSKFPYLIKHYYHHHEKSGGIAFIDFVVMHYGNLSSHAQLPEHQKLPFFNHSIPNLLFIIVQKLEIPPVLLFLIASKYSFFKDHYFFLPSFSLFQPPKYQ